MTSLSRALDLDEPTTRRDKIMHPPDEIIEEEPGIAEEPQKTGSNKRPNEQKYEFQEDVVVNDNKEEGDKEKYDLNQYLDLDFDALDLDKYK